jgi:hypothetical protein
MPLRARVYVYGVTALGAALLIGSLFGSRWPDVVHYGVFLALAIVASILKVRLPGLTGTYSFNFLFLLYGLMRFDLGPVLLAGAAAALAQSLLNVQKRPQAIQLAFNAGNLVISLAACFGLSALLARNNALTYFPAVLALMAAVYFVINTGLVSGVLSLLQGKPLATVAEEWYVWSFPYYLLGSVCLGLLPRVSDAEMSPASWLAVLPIVYLVHFFYGVSRGTRPRDMSASDDWSPEAGLLPFARLYVGLVLAGGAALFSYAMFNWNSSDPIRFGAYLALALIASTWKVRLPGMFGTISVSFVVVLVAIAELNLSETLVVCAGVAAMQSLWKPKRPAVGYQVAFNMAALVLSGGAGFAAGRWWFSSQITSSLVAVLPIAVVVFYCMNALLVSAAICAAEGKRLGQVWQSCYFWSLPYYLVGAAGAGLMIATQRAAGWMPAMAAVPILLLVYISYRAHISRSGGQAKQAAA